MWFTGKRWRGQVCISYMETCFLAPIIYAKLNYEIDGLKNAFLGNTELY